MATLTIGPAGKGAQEVGLTQSDGKTFTCRVGNLILREAIYRLPESKVPLTRCFFKGFDSLPLCETNAQTDIHLALLYGFKCLVESLAPAPR